MIYYQGKQISLHLSVAMFNVPHIITFNVILLICPLYFLWHHEKKCVSSLRQTLGVHMTQKQSNTSYSW